MKDNNLFFKELEAPVNGQRLTPPNERRLPQAASTDVRTAATFTNLVSELEMILTCYQEAAAEFTAQLKKLRGCPTPAGGWASLSVDFEGVVTLMAKQHELIKRSGLTASQPKTKKL